MAVANYRHIYEVVFVVNQESDGTLGSNSFGLCYADPAVEIVNVFSRRILDSEGVPPERTVRDLSPSEIDAICGECHGDIRTAPQLNRCHASFYCGDCHGDTSRPSGQNAPFCHHSWEQATLV